MQQLTEFQVYSACMASAGTYTLLQRHCAYTRHTRDSDVIDISVHHSRWMRSSRCQRWGLWWGGLCTGRCENRFLHVHRTKLALFSVWHGLSLTHCFLSMCSGICREGDDLVVGPTDSSHFHKLTIESIQRNRSGCRVLKAGQAATLALGNFDRSLLRKVRHVCLFVPNVSTKQKKPLGVRLI